MIPRLSSRSLRPLTALALLVALSLPARSSQAQSAAAPAAPAAPAAAPGAPSGPASGTSTTIGGATGGVSTTTTTYTPPVGFPPAGTQLEGHLPSSSRASGDTSRSSDGFDLGQGSGGPVVVRGDPSSPGVFGGRALRVPDFHVVRRGDTLWDLSDHYLRSPWYWPKVWSYNPQVQNPHWIYPGDHLRMRREGEKGGAAMAGSVLRGGRLTPSTVFLRDEAFIDSERKDVWGRVSGSPEDKMLLGDHDQIYLEMDKDHDVAPGDSLTIFTRIREAPKGGAVVKVMGTVKIDAWDKDKRLAKGTIIESIDIIERNATVGPVGRHFDVVAPARNEVDVSAHIMVATYPLALPAQNQVVHIDAGTTEGLRAGNRLFVLRRGDPWRRDLRGAGDLSDKTVKTTEQLRVETESVRGTARDKDYPDEIVGELHVLRARDHTATCLVVVSKRELQSGDLVVARKGYLLGIPPGFAEPRAPSPATNGARSASQVWMWSSTRRLPGSCTRSWA